MEFKVECMGTDAKRGTIALGETCLDEEGACRVVFVGVKDLGSPGERSQYDAFAMITPDGARRQAIRRESAIGPCRTTAS